MSIDNKEETPINVGQKPQEGGVKKFLLFAWDIIQIVVIAVVIVAPIRYFLFKPFIVSGTSMAPNFATGDYLIVDEISYKLSAPERGDVIVFNAGFIKNACGRDNYLGERFIKRIIGLPGETVNIKNGQVGITKDGKTITLDEKYLPVDLKTSPDESVTLKTDQYFVLGDNRIGSCDSRYWGVVDKKYIIGKAALRIFPITALSGISRPTY